MTQIGTWEGQAPHPDMQGSGVDYHPTRDGALIVTDPKGWGLPRNGGGSCEGTMVPETDISLPGGWQVDDVILMQDQGCATEYSTGTIERGE